MPDIVTCESCGQETYATIPRCPHCGAGMPTFDAEAHWSTRKVRFTGDSVAIYANRGWYILLLAILLGAAVFLLKDSYEAMLADPVSVLNEGAALWLLLALFAGWMAFRPGPAVVLDREGLSLPSLLAEPIPWSVVREVAVEERFLWIKPNSLVEVAGFKNPLLFRFVVVIRFVAPHDVRWRDAAWLPGPVAIAPWAQIQRQADSFEFRPRNAPLDARGLLDLILDRRRVWGI